MTSCAGWRRRKWPGNRLATMGLTQYQESGDVSLDLSRLLGTNATFRAAHTLRDDYKADIVCLVTELENLGIGGAAGDIPPPAEDQKGRSP